MIVVWSERGGATCRELVTGTFPATDVFKLGLPTALDVAPIMFVARDLLCSAGLLLFALANAKVIAALTAVAVVARARRVAKA